jgi:hypothetical protein
MNPLLAHPDTYATVQAYQHSDLLVRFTSKHGFSTADCELLFSDLKSWLYLVGTSTSDAPPLVIFPTMASIDDLWHEFILYTNDYANFCHAHFGHFVHHEPVREAEKVELRRRIKEDPITFRLQRREELETLVGFVYDTLGEHICERWFSGFWSQRS